MPGPGTGDRGTGEQPATLLRERSHRLVYAAETILIGAPSMTFCVPLLVMGMLFFGFGMSGPSASVGANLPYIALIVAGTAGVMAWLLLSSRLLFGGQPSLLAASRGWWIALAAGLVAAIAVGFIILSNGRWLKPLQWLTGPAMAVPAAHLFWLKYKYGRVHNQPRHPTDPAGSDSRLSMNAPLPPGPRSPVPGPGFTESPVPSPGHTESRVPSPGF